MCGPFLLSYAASWTRPASVLFQTAGDHARMPRVRLLVGCGVRCLPDVVGSRPHAPRLSAGHVRRPLSSGRRGIMSAMPPRLSAGRVRRPLSSGFGGRARMPRVCLLDRCGVRRLLDGGGITPACPASVQALRYYRAGGRANGRHPRRASLFLKF